MIYLDDKKIYLEFPEFTSENVPIEIAAKVMKKEVPFWNGI